MALIVLDSNILIYSADASSPFNERAKEWLEGLFSGSDRVGLPWVTVWSFLRITTNHRLFNHPLSVEAAETVVSDWLSHPSCLVIEPGPRHFQILFELVNRYQAAGPLLSDAVLAALALEHGGRLASTDRDFARFEKLNWLNPLEQFR